MERVSYVKVVANYSPTLNAANVVRACDSVKKAGGRIISIDYAELAHGWFVWYEGDDGIEDKLRSEGAGA
jgi:hypothetical protein